MSSGAVVANTVLGIDGLSTIGQLCVWGVGSLNVFTLILWLTMILVA